MDSIALSVVFLQFAIVNNLSVIRTWKKPKNYLFVFLPNPNASKSSLMRSFVQFVLGRATLCRCRVGLPFSCRFQVPTSQSSWSSQAGRNLQLLSEFRGHCTDWELEENFCRIPFFSTTRWKRDRIFNHTARPLESHQAKCKTLRAWTTAPWWSW